MSNDSGDASISSRESGRGSGGDSGASNFAREINTPGTSNSIDNTRSNNSLPSDFASNDHLLSQLNGSQSDTSPEAAKSTAQDAQNDPYKDAAAQAKNVPDDGMYRTADNDTTVAQAQAQNDGAAQNQSQFNGDTPQLANYNGDQAMADAKSVPDDGMYRTVGNDTTVAQAQQQQQQSNDATVGNDAQAQAQNIPDDGIYRTTDNDTTVAAQQQQQAQDAQAPATDAQQPQFNGDTPQYANYTADQAAADAKSIPNDGMYRSGNTEEAAWQDGQEQAQFATKDNADIKEPQEFPKDATQQVQDSRQRVLDDYKKSESDPAMQEKFETNMKDFEARAGQDGIPQSDVARTYDNVDKLLNTPSQYVTGEQRDVLAANVIDHAAHPDNIAQGVYDTCGATQIEKDMFKEDPAAASDMVQQAATSGQWTDSNGHSVDVSKTGALEPRPESREAYPQENDRSFATQIMNNVITNDMYQQGNDPKTYQQLGRGANLEYGDNGERLLDKNGNRVEPESSSQGRPLGPGSTDGQTGREREKLTGNPNGLLAYDPDHEAPKGVNGFSTKEEMEAKLQQNQNDGDTSTVSVMVREGGPNADLGGHYLTVNQYDADKHQAYITDSADITNNKWYSTNDLFNAAKRTR